MTFLFDHLAHGQKVVCILVKQQVNLIEPLDFFGGIVPPVTDDFPNKLTVLLFNMGVVILFVRSAAGDFSGLLLALA